MIPQSMLLSCMGGMVGCIEFVKGLSEPVNETDVMLRQFPEHPSQQEHCAFRCGASARAEQPLLAARAGRRGIYKLRIHQISLKSCN